MSLVFIAICIAFYCHQFHLEQRIEELEKLEYTIIKSEANIPFDNNTADGDYDWLLSGTKKSSSGTFTYCGQTGYKDHGSCS